MFKEDPLKLFFFLPMNTLAYFNDNYLADCRTPYQDGVIFHYTSSTTYGSSASVASCDTSAGYVGTPTTSTTSCSIYGYWSDVMGCTGKS